MNRRCRGLQSYAESGALTNKFRLIQRHFCKGRSGDSVSCCFNHFQRFSEPIILPLGMSELLHQLQQMILAANLYPNYFNEDLVIQLNWCIQVNLCYTLPHIQTA
ncbi:hypothetical protein D3C73_1441290 [compost metagenome]